MDPPIELRSWLTDLLVAFVARDVTVFRQFDQDVSSSAAKAVWWRRVGRRTAATALALLAGFLLVAASWQPGFPNLINHVGWTELSEALTFDERYRAAIAAGALALLRAVVGLLAAPGSQSEHGNLKSANPFRRRRK